MRTFVFASILAISSTFGCSNAESPSPAAPTGPRSPDAKFLPASTGTCPTIAQGKATFSPDGIARDVELHVDETAAKNQDGPLVFFWHGTGGSPDQAEDAFGETMKSILAAGGIVAAPYHDPKSGELPWYLSLGGTREDDLRVADEVLACIKESVGIDERRIYSMGFSAGAMHTAQFAVWRSGYLASIVLYSGARLGTMNEQDPTNLYPALLFHGGPTDQVFLQFEQTTLQYEQALLDNGQASVVCNHGMGHTVPAEGRAAAWQYLQDHPFAETPEPYTDALPAVFPAYCKP